MYLSQLVNRIRWSAAVLACSTMSFSPLALAKQAEKISRTQVENYIQESGLNKKQTWSDFYQKTKANCPESVAKKIEEFVKLNPDLPMPLVKVKTAQSPRGENATVLEISDNGKTYTVQVTGESSNWAKINGLTLTESDLENPVNALIRLQTGNIFFKKDADAFLAKHNVLPDPKLEEMKANLSLFKNFPRMTPQLWSSMTKSQRKDYIKQISDVWRAAEDVLKTESSSTKNKKTSLLENYLRYAFGNEAFAEEGPVVGTSGTGVVPPPGSPSATTVAAPAGTAQSSQDRVLDQLEQELRSNQALFDAYQSGTWTQELDRWLVQFEVSAERRAQEAVTTCISRTSTIRMDSADTQRIACENFGRQLLVNESVIAPLRSRACRAPAQYVGQYMPGEAVVSRNQKDELNRRDINAAQEQLCGCGNSGARVKFNEECPAAGSVASAQPPSVTSSERPAPAGTGSRNRSGSDNIWPLVIGGAAVGVLAGLLFFGKDKKKDSRSTASATTAVASCPANQVGTAPNCSCGPCTAPQRIYNFVTCQCTNVTNTVICPNNEMAPNGDSSKCLKCSDGTYKTTEPCPSATPANCVGANCGGVRPAIQ